MSARAKVRQREIIEEQRERDELAKAPKGKKNLFGGLFGSKARKKSGSLLDTYTRDEWVIILDSHALLYPYEHYQELSRQKAGIEVDMLKVRNSFLVGIPDDLRGSIWKLVSNVHLKREQYSSGLFDKFLQEDCTEEDEFCIGKDLARTVQGFSEFKVDPASGRNRLYNVLKAYSIFDKEVGYCQGINYIAAFFIMNIEEDEDAFWCLQELLYGKHQWRDIFSDNTPRLVRLLE
jgi:hypothetical protein